MHHRLHESASLGATDSTETVTNDSAGPTPPDGGSPYSSLDTAKQEKRQPKPEPKQDRLPDGAATEQAPAPQVATVDAQVWPRPDSVPPKETPKEASTGYLPPTAALAPPTETAPEKPPPAESATATADKPVDEPPVVGALRCCLDKRPADAVSRLGGYDKTNQELLLCVFSLAARLTEGRLQPQDIAVVLEELNSVMGPLRCQAALTIDKLCFCQHIFTFGIYQPWPPDKHWRPGDYVSIYAEVRNFSSRKIERSPGETVHVVELRSTAQIEDYAGNRVWPEEIIFQRKKPDESRTPRQDYFDNYHFFVPNLPPGAYKLWIQIEDVGTRPSRKARRSLDFYVTNLCAHTS